MTAFQHPATQLIYDVLLAYDFYDCPTEGATIKIVNTLKEKGFSIYNDKDLLDKVNQLRQDVVTELSEKYEILKKDDWKAIAATIQELAKSYKELKRANDAVGEILNRHW